MFDIPAVLEYMTKCMGRGLAVSAAIAMHNIPGSPPFSSFIVAVAGRGAMVARSPLCAQW